MANNKVGDELNRRRSEEYQMQLFGLHSRTAVAWITQQIKTAVNTRCQHIYTSINEKYKFDNEEKIALTKSIAQLRRSYHQNMKPHLEIMQDIVNRFICVPSNVLTDEDKSQEVQYSHEEFRELERKLETLQQQAKRVTIYNAALKEEFETTEEKKETEKLAKALLAMVKQSISTKKIDNKTVGAIEKLTTLKDSSDSFHQTQKDIYNPRFHEDEFKDINLPQ